MRRSWTPIAVIALVSGVLVATLLTPGIPALGESAWGADWTRWARPAAEQVRQALEQDRATLAIVLGLGGGLALSSVLMLLMGERERMRPSVTARWAIGASPRRLVRFLLGRQSGAFRRAVVAGAVLAIAGGTLLVASAPALEAGGWGVVLAGIAAFLVALALLTGAAAAGALSPLIGLEQRGPDTLRRGAGVTDDPRSGTVRRAVAVIQISAGFAMVVGSATLMLDRPEPPILTEGAADLRLASATVQDPLALVALDRTDPNLALASPGAFLGRGMRDAHLIWCGRCPRLGSGAMPVPMHFVDTIVHVVSTGFSGRAGLEVVQGRWLQAGDLGGPPVVVINQEMASYFHRRRALGQLIRIDRESDRWARVVGVVKNRRTGIPGGESSYTPVLYRPLSHPALLAGELEAVEVVGLSEADMRAAGLSIEGATWSLAEQHAMAMAPRTWWAFLLSIAGAFVALVALRSAGEVARVEAEGRLKVAGIRLALGAAPREPALRLARRVLKTTLLALGAGFLGARALTYSVGGFAMPQPTVTLVIGVAFLGVTLWGIRRPLRRLATVEPSRILREG